jgi:GNAT superfamily N-acetyltransferase
MNSEGVQEALLSGHSVVYVDAEDKPIGFCSVTGNGRRPLFVNPAHQGRGIGGVLLNYMERYSAGPANGEESNKGLRVFSTESAVPFYESHGYREIRRYHHMLDEVAILRVEMMKPMD